MRRKSFKCFSVVLRYLLNKMNETNQGKKMLYLRGVCCVCVCLFVFAFLNLAKKKEKEKFDRGTDNPGFFLVINKKYVCEYIKLNYENFVFFLLFFHFWLYLFNLLYLPACVHNSHIPLTVPSILFSPTSSPRAQMLIYFHVTQSPLCI